MSLFLQAGKPYSPTLELGKVKDGTLQARLYFDRQWQNIENDEFLESELKKQGKSFSGYRKTDVGNFSLEFITKLKSGAISTKRVEAVTEGYRSSLKVMSIPILKNGRKQVFISLTIGSIRSYVFDFDGEHIQRLYQVDSGRVRVSAVKGTNGIWKLQELWPERQWIDESNLGEGRRVTEHTIRRYLHWNSRAFVPDRPGKTRIVP